MNYENLNIGDLIDANNATNKGTPLKHLISVYAYSNITSPPISGVYNFIYESTPSKDVFNTDFSICYNVPNIKEIISISKESNLFVIEDFSQCLNGKFKAQKVGTFGDVGVYSASSIKTLDTYGGGLLVCRNKKLFSTKILRKLAA